MDPAVLWVSALTLACVLLHGAVHKIRARVVFIATLRDYQLLPSWSVPLAGTMLPWLELAVAALLLLPGYQTMGAACAAGLLVVYTLAMAINILRGRRYIDCGCAGPAHRQPLSAWLLVRNGSLLLLTAAVFLSSAMDRALVWLDFLTISAGAVVALLLYGIGNALAANQPRSLVIQNG